MFIGWSAESMAMMDKAALKREGLSLATSIQSLLRTVGMYSVDHPAAERILQQAFNLLNSLLKQTREFTLGFFNQRLLLNQTLTAEGSTGPLASEFSRRGIGAVTFAAGISFREFKRAVALLSTRPKVIEENGGIRRLLERNPIEGVRILPARKPDQEAEDTDLQIDVQSYITAQAILDSPFLAGGSSPESATRYESGGGGTSPSEVMQLSRQAMRAALTDPEKDLRQSMDALARWLSTLTPEALMAALPGGKRGELSRLPPGDMAKELVEDETAGWASDKLSQSANSPGAKAGETEVLHGLLRGIQATQAVERLLQKLERVIRDAGLPAEVFDRIRREVMWHLLTRKEKHTELMRLRHFTELDFRRLIGYLHEAVNAGAVQDALQLATHFLTRVSSAPPENLAGEIARLPELLTAIAGPQTLGFVRDVAAWVSHQLSRKEPEAWTCHQLAAECLNSISQSVARYEDFDLVQTIGLGLKRSWTTDENRHQGCCGKALSNLISPATTQRLVERYLEERDNAGWARTVVSLLKLVGTNGAEVVFQLLEEETAAANRMRLVRLLVQLGAAAREPTKKRLASDKWFVVRNACFVLGSLGDPNLPKLLGAPLRHADHRVQQSALTAILKSQAPGCAPVLAEALCDLKGSGLDMAMDELMFLKDSSAIDGLARFIFRSGNANQAAVEKGIRVLASIPSERSAQMLEQMLRDASQPVCIRRVALQSLSSSPFAQVQRMLTEFAYQTENDPCVKECRQILGLTA
jgi:HEAT repeat protein